MKASCVFSFVPHCILLSTALDFEMNSALHGVTSRKLTPSPPLGGMGPRHKDKLLESLKFTSYDTE